MMGWPRGTLCVTVLAALVVTACGGPSATVARLTPSPSSAITTAAPPASGAPPAPAPTPTPAPALAAGWEVTLEMPEAQLFDLEPVGDSVLLAGEDGNGFVLERSPDGRWGPPARPTSGASFAITGLAHGPDAVVAIGVGPADASGDPWPRGMAWRRADGGWIQARMAATEPVAYPRAVVWTEEGFVAVGDLGCLRPTIASVERARLALATPGRRLASDPCASDPDWSRPMAWTSADGASWTPDPGFPDQAGLLRRVIGGPAGLLAIGSLGERPAAWLRVDGSWQPVAFPVEDGWLADVGAVADAYLLLSHGPEDSTLWRSADARTWERVPLDFPMQVLVGTPGGLVGLGGEIDVTDDAPMPVGQPAIAVTRDGRTWARLPGDPVLEGKGLVDLVVTPQGRAILLGGDWGSGSEVFEADAQSLGIAVVP